MKERPILFSAPMVRVILAGSKTQTRRVMKPQPRYDANWRNWTYGKIGAIVASDSRGYDAQGFTVTKMCPYGEVGDRLWVRETWFQTGGDVFYRASHNDALYGEYARENGGWKPSIYMPRWASRITLEITGVRAERVQNISEADAIAEGVDYIPAAPAALNHRTAFAGLWNSINAARGYGWDVNPWVWVIAFRRLP